MIDVALLILATVIVTVAIPRFVAWRENAQRAALIRQATEFRREFDVTHDAKPDWVTAA